MFVCVSLYVRLSEQTNVDRSNSNDGGGLRYCHCSIAARDRVSWVTLIQTSKDRIRKDEQQEWMRSEWRDGGPERERERERARKMEKAQIFKKTKTSLYYIVVRYDLPLTVFIAYVCTAHSPYTAPIWYNVIRVMYTRTQTHEGVYTRSITSSPSGPLGCYCTDKGEKTTTTTSGNCRRVFW